MVVLCSTTLKSNQKCIIMETGNLTTTLLEIGLYDNVLPHWFEAANHRDKANRETRNISELLAHPSKDKCAYHWAIASRDFIALEGVIMDTMKTELEEVMTDNPMMVIMAALEAMSELMDED